MPKMPLWSLMLNYKAEQFSSIEKTHHRNCDGFLITIFTSNSVQVKE